MMTRQLRKQVACLSPVLLLIWCCLVGVYASGLGANNHSSSCVDFERDLRGLLINQDQAYNGLEGNLVVPNDCKILVQADVLSYRSDNDQKALCANSCYSTLNAKYKLLLDNNCFTDTDKNQQASATLLAGAYQIACQTTKDGKYCIPMLANLIANAGTSYDLCSDIVKDMGCCFQSYKQYMIKAATPAAIATLNKLQDTCTKQGVTGLDTVCPCGVGNVYNIHAFKDTTICSGGRHPTLSWTTLILLLVMLFLHVE